MVRSFVLVLLTLCSAQLLRGQQFTTPLRVNHDKSLGSQRSPMMKLGRDGRIYIAWVNADAGSGGPILMSVSSDGGENFTNDVTVCADANCNADFQRTAQFVLDTEDNIHMIWMGNRVNNPSTAKLQPDIWYVRSTDHGTSWTSPVSLSGADDSSIYAQDFPSIACDSSDNLYVTFLDSRETQRKINTNVHLYFTKSTDGGKSWSESHKIEVLPSGMGGTCECCTENIATTPDGHLYVAFRSNINNLRNIWLERSPDGGATWLPALLVQNGDWHINECPVSGPGVALDDSEGVHIVWRDARDDSAGVSHTYYAFVPKGSTTIPFNDQFDADGAAMANYASVALYDHSKYRVIAYQTQNYGTRYILYADGNMVIRNRPIPSGGSQQFVTVLFAADGTRYLSWQDAKSDAGDIYFCKEISALPTASAPASAQPSTNISIFPNPVSSSRHTVTFQSPARDGVLRLLDLKGNTLLRTEVRSDGNPSEINIGSVAAGVYECTFEHDGTTDVRLLEVR